MNIPSNQKGPAQYQRKQDHQFALMDQVLRKEASERNGLIHMINDAPSNANAERGHPTLGNVVDRKA